MNRIVGKISITTVQPVSFSHHGIDGLPTMTRGVDIYGDPQRTVFIPGSAIRGRLRHEVAFNALRQEGGVTLKRAYLTALGQSTDGRVEDDTSDEPVRLGEMRQARAAEPIADLFGQWKWPSRLQVGNLLPDVNVDPDAFHFIRRDLDTNEAIMGLLPDGELDAFYSRQSANSDASRVDAQVDVAQRELRKAKKEKNNDLAVALEVKIAELKKQHKAFKDAMGDVQNSTKHLLEVQAIPAGVTLSGRVLIERALPRDLTMLAGAFEAISLRPQLGAHAARGFGEIEGRAEFAMQTGEMLLVATFGGFGAATVSWTPAGMEFFESKTDKAA
jgi:CRISPR/Cas system CSM-associated protein Csm3 (group 7 of RAMP superfamily)